MDDDKPRLQATKQNSDFFAKLLKQADNKKIDDSLEKEAITSGQKSYMKFLKKFGLRLVVLLTNKQVATYQFWTIWF